MEKNKPALWVSNQSKTDVHLSDLGVKVPMGKTINIYKVNPYLTVQQVERSMLDGALFKRLSGTSPALKIVKKDTRARPVALDKLKQSNVPLNVKRTKSSVVIETSLDGDTESKDFDFADYGVTDLGPNVSQVKEKSAVFVQSKEDPDDTAKIDPIMAPKIDTNISKQSTVVMDTMSKNVTNPVGPLAKNGAVNKPYTVTSPPDAPVKKVKAEKFDAKVATKTKEGHIVMEIKEVPAKPKKK